MFRNYPLYPLLFAMYPVFFLYSINMDETPFVDILAPLAICVISTLLLYALLQIFIKDKQRTAIIVSLVLFVILAHGHLNGLHGPIKELTGFYTSKDKILLFQGIIFTLGTFYALKAKESLATATKFLSYFSLALLVACGFTIGSFAVNKAAHASKREKIVKRNDHLAPILQGQKPDVYYMIFDAYPRADIIERHLKGSNQPFIKALEKRGFYVASKSCSNYPRTFLSLSSSLNFKYVNYLEKGNRDKKKDYSGFTDLLGDHELQRQMKGMGYKYVHVGSWSPPFKKNENADINLVGPADEFFLEFTQTTLFAKFMKEDLYYNTLRKHILKSLKQLEEVVPSIQGPKFVFAHVICPHPPYHFDRHGNPISVDYHSKDKEMLKRVFNDQLVYLNSRILKIIDEILAHSKTPPIIIIQGDHGSPIMGNLTNDWNHAYIEERLSILNAYHLPGNGAENRLNIVYPTITPVNSFRRVLNYYYGTNYSALPDEQYFIYPERPYVFYNMTGKGDCQLK